MTARSHVYHSLQCMHVQVIHTDLPTTLNAMERTSLEFEELGRSLNMLSGPIKRAAVPALAVRAVSNNTGDGMRRIANDVTSLTLVRALGTAACFQQACQVGANLDAQRTASSAKR